jgi:hypothetical protein
MLAAVLGAAVVVTTAAASSSAAVTAVEPALTLEGNWTGTQTCQASLAGRCAEPEPDQKLTLTANGSGVFQGDLVLASTQLTRGPRGDSYFVTGDVRGSSDGKVHGTYMLQATATKLVGSWTSWTGSERLFVWNMERGEPAGPSACPCGRNATSDACVACKPAPAVKLSPLHTVFENPHYPECCTVAMDPSQVCFYRIPVVLSVPRSPVVLAFAEARLGKASGRGCSDGSGPALAMKRSTDYGTSWGTTQWIANDTEPLHERLKDGIVLGVSLYEPASESAYFFYTACYVKCVYTTAYVLRSTDRGSSWSKPADGNLTDMLLQHNISMMQWGEGQGLVLPNGDLLACGWFKQAGREPGESDATDSVACVASSDHGKSWSLRGQLPMPHEPTNEVAAALTPNGSVYLSMRTNAKMPQRMQSWSTDNGHSFAPIDMGPLPAPKCNAGAINPGSDNKRLLLAHIEPTEAAPGRRNMMLRVSENGGDSFAAPVQLDRGIAGAAGMPAGYVTLTTTDDSSTVGALYENAGDLNGSCYARISYQNITLL